MCFVWISEQTAIISLYGINWLVFNTEISPVKPSVYYMYRQFNIQQFYVLHTHTHTHTHTVFKCFVWISEQTAIISLYSTNWLVFIIEIGPIKPSIYYMYGQFNIQQF